MAATYATLMQDDARLVRSGQFSLSPYWQENAQAYYGQAALILVARVGRGGTKSFFTVRVGANETIHGDFAVPPGEIHYWAHVAENKTEASERLRLFDATFTALGIAHEWSGDSIIIPSLRRGVRVLACQVGAVSGFRCYGYAADELAKWQNADHNANPAEEVCASLDAMTVTHPAARKLLVSSPLATLDHHYDLFEQGTNEYQYTCYAPSWIANPGISEAQCRKLAKGNNRVFLREYAAIPQDAMSAAFESDLIDAAFRPDPIGQLCEPLLSLDPSGGHGDSFVWGTLQWCKPADGNPILIVNETEGISGEFYGRVRLDTILKKVSERAKRDGARIAVSDAREELALQSGFSRTGVRYVRIPWTSANKAAAVARLRRLLSERAIVFSPKDEKLKAELLNFQEKIMPSGVITYGARRAGHDDRVAIVLTALMAEQLGLLSGSPITPARAPVWVMGNRGERNHDGTRERGSIHVYDGNAEPPPGDFAERYRLAVAERQRKLLSDER